MLQTPALMGCAVVGDAAPVRAVSRTARHLAFGLRLRRARRSRSVIPPQTPHSIWFSRASARHSAFTGQPAQSFLALFCSAPRTNSWSGDDARQAAWLAHSSFHMTDVPTSVSDRRPHDAAGFHQK